MFPLGKALAHLQIVERCALCVLRDGEEENISTQLLCFSLLSGRLYLAIPGDRVAGQCDHSM